jgi:hypothetical protein
VLDALRSESLAPLWATFTIPGDGVELAAPIVLLPVAVVTTLIPFMPTLVTTPLCALSLPPLPPILSISFSIDSAAALIVNAAVTTILSISTASRRRAPGRRNHR